MQNKLSYSKYYITKTLEGTAYCPVCAEQTESNILVPKSHDLPCFVICWNCHDVRQAGVGSLRDAEQCVHLPIGGEQIDGQDEKPATEIETGNQVETDTAPHSDGR